MLRQFLLGKIHRCRVTRADLDYQGSVTLDPLLAEAAGFLVNEKIDLYNVTTGARFSTYVILGERGSGEVGVNGAAAHLVKVGHLMILAAYGWLDEAERVALVPRVVFVDGDNRITDVRGEESNPPLRAAK